MSNGKDIQALVRELHGRAPEDAAAMLRAESPERVRAALKLLPSGFAMRIAALLPPAQRPFMGETGARKGKTALTVADVIDPVPASVPIDATVSTAVNTIRQAEIPTEVTYLYVTDNDNRLAGLVVIRDLLLAGSDATVNSVMLAQPFSLQSGALLADACKAAVHRHYPVYPVVDAEQHLIGQVRGWRLFEHQMVEISAQSGKMVGVQEGERVYTPMRASFIKRHPWLQINLMTGFVSAFVVGAFSGTIESIVALAAFLPVLAGQAGNTGCQALAITLRGLALGDLDNRPKMKLLAKEAWLGLVNGLLTGLVAAAAMWLYAANTGSASEAPLLALSILLAMVGSCFMAGILGVVIPLLLRKFGADPAVASAIFLTTGTEIAGMGLMLALATALIF